jgi:hypothetical protein
MAHAASATETALFGLLAEFETAQQLMDAVHRTREAGYTRTDAYSPFPIHGLAEALGFKDRRISTLVLAGGITGALAGYGLQYWVSVIAYPLNVGGRPFHSWVSFIPPTFETTILFAAFTAGISMIALNGLPRPYHPVFHAERFARASQDRFFLTIEAGDPKFQLEETRAFLAGLGAASVEALDE